MFFSTSKKNVNMETCTTCKQPFVSNGFSTGYGINRVTGEKFCYDCIGKTDLLELENLKVGEKISLYYISAKKEITNWPGSLKLSANHYEIKHNICRNALYVYFFHNNRRYYGRIMGNTQVINIRVRK